MKSTGSTTLIIIGVILIILLCCICVLFIGFGAGIIYLSSSSVETNIGPLWNPSPTYTPEVVRPTHQSSDANGSGDIVTFVVPSDTLDALRNTNIPNNNLPDLAERLHGINNVPETMEPPPGAQVVGSQQEFWVTNVDSNESYKISANL